MNLEFIALQLELIKKEVKDLENELDYMIKNSIYDIEKFIEIDKKRRELREVTDALYGLYKGF